MRLAVSARIRAAMAAGLALMLCPPAVAHGWDEMMSVPPENLGGLVITLNAVADLWDEIPPEEKGALDRTVEPVSRLSVALEVLRRSRPRDLADLPVDPAFTNPVSGRLSQHALVEHTRSLLGFLEDQNAHDHAGPAQDHPEVSRATIDAVHAALDRLGVSR